MTIDKFEDDVVRARFEILKCEGLERAVVVARRVGIPVSVPTLLRWCISGQLEAVKLCGSWWTSEAALRRFVVKCNDTQERQGGSSSGHLARRKTRGPSCRPADDKAKNLATRSALAKFGLAPKSEP